MNGAGSAVLIVLLCAVGLLAYIGGLLCLVVYIAFW